jgi:type IV pilus assembly protein PilO
MTLDELNQLSFKEIGDWPIPVKIVSMTLLFAVLMFLGYWFDWSNQLEGLNTAKTEESKLWDQFIVKKKQAVNLDTYRQQLKEIEQAFGALVRQLPNKSEMDALLTDINQAGLGRGLQFELFKPGQEITKEFYAELPINVSVSGSYHDLGAFASDIAQLPRIVTLSDISISEKDSKSDRLTMDAVVHTYRYLDENEIAEQHKAAKKGGKK